MYSIDGAKAVSAVRTTLTAEGLLERTHLQEWVIEHPEMLGEDLLIVSFEYDRWLTGAGSATYERLDVLALDKFGRLVVAELKRDKAPDSVVVQAINYAAMVRGFSVDQLAEVYLARKPELETVEAALAELQDWADTLSDDTLAPPRVVLVAEEFGPVVTNTSLFLIEQGLDLRLIRVQLYRSAENVLTMTASQLLPVPDVEEFMVRPRSVAQTQRTTRAAATRRATIPDRIVSAGELEDGARLTIAVPNGVNEDRKRIAAWLQEDPQRSQVAWRNDAKNPLTWSVDGNIYNTSNLIRLIIEKATGAPPHTQIWGPNWYLMPNGQVMYKFADSLSDRREGGGTA